MLRTLQTFLANAPARSNPSPRWERWGVSNSKFLADISDPPLEASKADVAAALASGLRMFRGDKRSTSRFGWSTDAGNYGRGLYWTTDPNLAWYYAAYDEGAVRENLVRLTNPRVLDAKEAQDMRRHYGTNDHDSDPQDRLDAAERLTRDLVALGYDGVAVLHPRSVEVVVYPANR